MPIVIRDTPRTALDILDGLAAAGVATVHEAQGRTGLLDPSLRPVWLGPAIAGNALTCTVAPGDNWTIHVALEMAQEGDILVVVPTSRCDDGYFGDLLATSAMARGVRGLVIAAGVRDVAELEAMRFPVWSRCVSAQGTVKHVLGDVQVTIACGGTVIAAGDAVVADRDGVCIVPRANAARVASAAAARAASESEKRQRYAAGELSLDVNSMREALQSAGLRYADWAE